MADIAMIRNVFPQILTGFGDWRAQKQWLLLTLTHLLSPAVWASGCADSSSHKPHWRAAASQADLFVVVLQRMRSAGQRCVCKKLSVDHPQMHPSRVKPLYTRLILNKYARFCPLWGWETASQRCFYTRSGTCIMLCQIMAKRHGWHSCKDSLN